MRIRINGELCSGHGRCYTEAPTAYTSDSDGFSDRRDVNRTVRPGFEEAAGTGAYACPEGAITIFED